MAKSKNDYTFDDIKAMLLKEKEKLMVIYY